MLNQQTPLIMSRQRSRTKKEFLQINKDLSSLVNNLRTIEPSLTTTFKRNLPSTSFLDLEEVCKSLLKP
jgi:hypothetical protein